MRKEPAMFKTASSSFWLGALLGIMTALTSVKMVTDVLVSRRSTETASGASIVMMQNRLRSEQSSMLAMLKGMEPKGAGEDAMADGREGDDGTDKADKDEKDPDRPPSGVSSGGVDGTPSKEAGSGDDEGGAAREKRAGETHVVFTSGCNLYQQWQAEVLLHSHREVGQPGKITRIVSGCSAERKSEEESKKVYRSHGGGINDEVLPLDELKKTSHPSAGLHVAPEFQGADIFPWLNKPLGIADWVSKNHKLDDDDTIVIIDVDMIFMDVLDVGKHTACTGGCPSGRWGGTTIEDARADGKLQHGRPIAQLYGIGDAWTRKFDIASMLGKDSPALKVNSAEALQYYSVGPPYIMTGKDAKMLAPLWAELIRKVIKVETDILADMWAYSMAAAHLGMRHVVYDSFMISSPIYPQGEAWQSSEMTWSGPTKEGLTCSQPFPRRDSASVRLPTFLHLCQTYKRDGWEFHKGMVPGNMLACHVPLLLSPPESLVRDSAVSLHVPGGGRGRRGGGGGGIGGDGNGGTAAPERHGQMICAATLAINKAVKAYKGKHCGGGGGNVSQGVMLKVSKPKCDGLHLKEGINCWHLALVES